MPEYGLKSKNVGIALEMLEHCRFIYKIYSQTLAYPMDPFYESHTEQGDSARERLFDKIHKQLKTPEDSAKFDPIQYKLTETPNPHRSIVYRLDEKKLHILWQPRALDKTIRYAKGFNSAGKAVDGGLNLAATATGTSRCTFFQGRTGMTLTHPDAGWKSWFGSVIYEPLSKTVVIAFRGSRSGAGERAAIAAQFKSKGSPDWVTDMNHLKSLHVHAYHEAKFAAGFYHAYESCKKSLKAAYLDAVNGATPNQILVTGHSLGAAFAQHCYVNLKIGDLGEVLNLAGREEQVPIYCYAISGPPILHGQKAHNALALRVDASQIFHYFCPKDNVHESVLVDPSASKHGLATFMHAMTHPQTHPQHLGVEIAVHNTVDFPGAHEPVEVWKGLTNGVGPDNSYWPTFQFDPTADTLDKVITQFSNNNLKNELKAALRLSMTSDLALQRAAEWLSVIKNDDNQGKFLTDLSEYHKAIRIIGELRGRELGEGNLIDGMRRKVREARAQIIKNFREAGGKASGAAYWSLMQGLTVEQLLLDGF